MSDQLEKRFIFAQPLTAEQIAKLNWDVQTSIEIFTKDATAVEIVKIGDAYWLTFNDKYGGDRRQTVVGPRGKLYHTAEEYLGRNQ